MTILWWFLLFVGWSVVHSITAAFGLKGWFRQTFGEAAYVGWYRLLYNFFSLVTFLPIYLLMPVLLPQNVLWSWERPYLSIAQIMQIVGLVGLAYSLWITDVWSFLGIRQALWHLRGVQGSVPEPQFTRKGPYALVRHPLYTFSLILLWFNPVITVSQCIFYSGATLYFWLGSIYEERKLAAHFGDVYRQYQQTTPRLIPFLNLRR